MKEAIEEVIERYEKRVESLKELIRNSREEYDNIRRTGKKSVYLEVIRELKQLLRDESD